MYEYEEFFSNISSYNEYALKCAILGKKTNDPEILESVFHEIENYFWTVAGGQLLFVDPKTGCKIILSKVIRDFDCSETQLTSLKSAPSKVGGSFDCSYNQLTSLEGAPSKVGGYFFWSGNPNLTKKQIDDYLAFLKHPTLDLMDETGHYKPRE